MKWVKFIVAILCGVAVTGYMGYLFTQTLFMASMVEEQYDQNLYWYLAPMGVVVLGAAAVTVYLVIGTVKEYRRSRSEEDTR